MKALEIIIALFVGFILLYSLGIFIIMWVSNRK